MSNILFNTEPIATDDGTYLPLLKNIQGNILKGHGRENAVLIFFRFLNRPPEEIRPPLIDLLRIVRSAADQIHEAEQYGRFRIPGGIFANFFLSFTGYQALGFDGILDPPLAAGAFRTGMKNYADLHDPAQEAWEKPYRDQIDAMLLLADDDAGYLLRQARATIDKIEEFATIVTVERGAALRNEKGEGVEHFGFADGRSQPVFLASEIAAEGPANVWNPFVPLKLVLTRDVAVPGDETACGSFLVYRKLEQDVRRFAIREQELADEMQLEGSDRDRVGAMVVGRFRDGSPLISSSIADPRAQNANDFNYTGDVDASKCPMHSHIRKANPRGEAPNDPNRLIRITRRGIPYGVRKRHPHEFQSLEELPSEGVGLLFMCFQWLIESGFNFIHTRWVNETEFRDAGTGLDALLGQGAATGTAQKWPAVWGTKEPHHDAPFGGFVKMIGGEYFFAPSIAFLRTLAPQPGQTAE